MKLDGSCRCGAVRFSCETRYPVPYQRCYCTICRKTGGGGGYAINISAETDTLRIVGEENIEMFHARIDGQISHGERRFCRKCGSALWVYDDNWPELIHPFASVIDTELPQPKERTHLMLDFKAGWVEPQIGPNDKTFGRYPDESIADWHERTGSTVD